MSESILSYKVEKGVTIITVHPKKLFQRLVDPFREDVEALLDKGHLNIIIDLSNVEVMNSSALGILILTMDRLNKENGKMAVTGLHSLLEELFHRMRLDTLIPVAQNLDEAFNLIVKKSKD